MEPFASLPYLAEIPRGKNGAWEFLFSLYRPEGDKNKVEGYRENLGGVGSREGRKKKLE